MQAGAVYLFILRPLTTLGRPARSSQKQKRPALPMTPPHSAVPAITTIPRRSPKVRHQAFVVLDHPSSHPQSASGHRAALVSPPRAPRRPSAERRRRDRRRHWRGRGPPWRRPRGGGLRGRWARSAVPPRRRAGTRFFPRSGEGVAESSLQRPK